MTPSRIQTTTTNGILATTVAPDATGRPGRLRLAGSPRRFRVDLLDLSGDDVPGELAGSGVSGFDQLRREVRVVQDPPKCAGQRRGVARGHEQALHAVADH